MASAFGHEADQLCSQAGQVSWMEVVAVDWGDLLMIAITLAPFAAVLLYIVTHP